MRAFSWLALVVVVLSIASCSSSSGGAGGADVADNDVGGDSDGGGVDQGGEDVVPDGPAPGNLLTGDADDDAWAAIPELRLAAPDPSRIVSDEALGMVDNRLALWLADGATIGEVNAALAGFEVTIVGGEPALGWLVAELAPGDLEAAVEAADASDAFDVVNLDLIYPSQVLAPHHNSPGDLSGDGDYDRWEWETLDRGASWGLKFIHAPAAWNLRPLMHGPASGGPRAVVIDNSFPEHRDVSFAEGSSLGPANENPHGTAVASIMAAHWNDEGVEGVFPAAVWIDEEQQSMDVLALRSTSAMGNVQGLTDALLLAALDEHPLVANQSLGTNYFSGNPDDGFELKEPDDYADWSFNTYRQLNQREGRAWRAFATRAERELGISRWLLICSAGNSNIDDYVHERTDVGPRRFTAAENSGCGWAASQGDSHFMAIENLGPPGDVLDHVSHRDGTLAAPGNAIGQAASDNDYRAEGGTSFAAPMVAGAALVLWSLEPEATHQQVRAALTGSARPAVTDSAPRLDLWAAILALDALDEEPDLVRFAADIDDRTVDGALRATPEGVVNETVPESGDQCLDAADFRALRDALLEGRLVATWYRGLDGDKEHVKRDLNGDGGFNYTADSDVEAPEGYFARQDLNGDGQLTDDDVAVLAEHWGECWNGAGPADTRALAANDLAQRLASLDIWVELPSESFVTVTATGARPVTLRGGVDETVEGYAMLTVPFEACGDFVVRTAAADGTQRQWRPEGDPEAGNDLVVGEGSAADINRTVPLAFYQAADGDSWILLYDGSTPTEVSDPGIEMMVSPDGVLAFQGDEAIDFATGSETWRIDIDGTVDDFLPWQWAPSGRALLASNVTSIDFDDDLFAYVDLDRQQGWILDPEVTQRYDDWPTIDNNGVIWMTGEDGHIYTIAPPPVGIADWDSFIDELIGAAEPTCDAGAAAGADAPPAVRFDDVAGWASLFLAKAEPTSISDTGLVAVRAIRENEVTDLIVLSPDGTRAATIRSGWTPRGGNDLGFLGFVPDYVSWSPSGQYLAFGDTDGIYVADLGEDYWDFPEEGDITTRRISERLGAVAFAPADDRLMVVEVSGPPAELVADVTVLTLAGDEVVTYAHGPRWGNPGWSGLGAQIVVVDTSDLLTRPDLKVVSAYRDEVFFETGDWRGEGGGRSHEQFPQWGRSMRGH